MKLQTILERNRHWLSAAIILSGVVLYLFGGLLTSAPLDTHEYLFPYFRIQQYVTEFRHNGFPPALFPDAIYGGGFAFPVFYPPFSYYIATGLAAVTGSCYFAGNFTLFLSVLVSAYTAFWGFTRISRYSTALTASVLYVTIPYRFVDAMVRGSLAESWAFPWYPLIFCGGMLLLRGENRKGLAFIALSSAALLMTHAVMGVYFLGICMPMFIAACLLGKRLAALGYSILAMLFAVGFSAWYIIPQRAHWDSVRASELNLMWSTLKHLRTHNVYLSQFFFSDSARWFGGSYKGIRDEMSFELGYSYFVAAFVWFSGLLWYRERRAPQSRAEVTVKYFSVAALLGCLLFVLHSDWFLADAPDALLYIQFTWRMLGITAFLCVAIYVMVLNSYRLTYRVRTLLSVAAILGSIASVDSTQRSVQYLEKYPEEPLTSAKLSSYSERGYVYLREYLPKGFSDYSLGLVKSKQISSRGDMDITAETETYTQRTYKVVARTSSTMILPLVAYPFYEAKTAAGRILDRGEENGLMTIEAVQPGDERVIVRRVHSKSQKLGLFLTAATVGVFIVLLFLPIWNFGKPVRSQLSSASPLPAKISSGTQ